MLAPNQDEILILKVINYLTRGLPKDQTIYSLTKEQFINTAYDYTIFLSNDHESTDYLTR